MSGKKHTGGGYKYVHSFIDNRGTRRWRYFRRGYPSTYLPAPSAPEFLEAYTAALKKPRKGFEQTGYSLGKAIDAYTASRSFTELADGTKPGYESLLRQIGANYGRYSIESLTRPALQNLLDNIESSSKRNRVLSMFRLVLENAVNSEIIPHNVAKDIKRARHKSVGYTTWSTDNIKAFADHYGPDSMETLALYILYYTGQRSSDAVRMGAHSIVDGRIRITQQKTGAQISLPIHPRLADVIPDRPIWIVNGYGNPFSAKGFQQWLVKKIKPAGLIGLSGHGLRKALGTHLANKGATPHHIKAVLGHKQLSEVALYTRFANQETLADEAISMLE